MTCQIFEFTSEALNAIAYDQANEQLNQWFQDHPNIQVQFATQSSHIRHEDGVEFVDLIYTIYYSN